MTDYRKIVKALRCCATPNGCENCPYDGIAGCGVSVSLNAADAIEELCKAMEGGAKHA